MAITLISKGATADLYSYGGQTPLIMAIQLKNKDMVRTLVEQGANLNYPGVNGDTPLTKAIRIGDKIIFDFLIEKGADINLPGKNGETPWMIAEDMQNESLLTCLINHKNFNENKYLKEGASLNNLATIINHKTIDSLKKKIEERQSNSNNLAVGVATTAIAIVTTAVNIINNTTAINTAGSTALQVVNPNQIAQSTSSFDSSEWIVGGAVVTGAVAVTGLVAAGIIFVKRACTPATNYVDVID